MEPAQYDHYSSVKGMVSKLKNMDGYGSPAFMWLISKEYR